VSRRSGVGGARRLAGSTVDTTQETGGGIRIPIDPHDAELPLLLKEMRATTENLNALVEHARDGVEHAAGTLGDTVQRVHETVQGTSRSVLVTLASMVAGHADKASASDGSNQYFEKLALSKTRATQTVRVLKGNGVDSQSFIVEWYGDIRPIASKETEDGRQLNRRIEIVLYAGI
jgi:hypothetical protein